MAFERFSKNMNIISALANKPVAEGGLTPSAFKAKFDEGGLALKDFVNALCGELEGGNAAAWIGIQSITGLDATTIQGALAALKSLASQTPSHASTHETDGSDPLTPANIGAAAFNHTHSPASIGAAAATHNHNASAINAGTLSITRGGTGASDAATARTNLGAAANIHTHTPASIGAAAADHTHTPASIGAAAENHTHSSLSGFSEEVWTFTLADGSTISRTVLKK